MKETKRKFYKKICKWKKQILCVGAGIFLGIAAWLAQGMDPVIEAGNVIQRPDIDDGQVDQELYVKELEKKADDNLLIMLCPKTTFALLGTEKASLEDVELSAPMRYGEACIEVIGKVKLTGQMCIKNIQHMPIMKQEKQILQ